MFELHTHFDTAKDNLGIKTQTDRYLFCFHSRNPLGSGARSPLRHFDLFGALWLAEHFTLALHRRLALEERRPICVN